MSLVGWMTSQRSFECCSTVAESFGLDVEKRPEWLAYFAPTMRGLIA
jgi:hypothetical protein